MFLTRLSLTNFRIFSRLDLEIPRRVILLSGSNAQGKTSVLEAISFLATFSSFHASNDRQLLNYNLTLEPVQVGRIVADFVKGERAHTMEVRLVKEYNGNPNAPKFRKEVLLDGVKRRISDLFGQFNAVSFLPQMSKIVEDGPAERRLYLDQLLCQAEPGYARHLSNFNKALQQRNALLKMLGEQGGDARQLEIWDEVIARHAAELMQARINVLHELEYAARPIHSKLTDGAEVLRLVYQPSYEPLPAPKGQMLLLDSQLDRSGLKVEELENGYKVALRANYREDINRGLTSLGPHRDEFRFFINKIDLGDFGSRGQSRTVLLSLKFAEVEWMHARTGEWPVLLLDEIMAELDPKRRGDLIGVLDEVEQALLTATDPEMFTSDFTQRHEIWQVKDGMVFKQTQSEPSLE